MSEVTSINPMQDRLNRAVTRGDATEVAAILQLMNEQAAKNYRIAASYPCKHCERLGRVHDERCSQHPWNIP